MMHNSAAIDARDVSVDFFRGITIFLMIWVNDLAGVTGIPAWLKHFPADGNGMTMVDIVFPAFLFISGMSIPLAFRNRREEMNFTRDLFHAGKRGLSLIIIGVLMVNIGSVNAELTGLSKYQWGLMVLTGVILFFNSYFKGKSEIAVKIIGAILIIWGVIIFRGGSAEIPLGMRTQWWGIIGLIGWAYIFVATLYVFAGKSLWAAAGSMVMLLLLNIADWSGVFGVPGSPDMILRPGIQIGGHGFIMCAGLLLGLMKEKFTGEGTDKKFYSASALFVLMLFLAGYITAPAFGVNKNDATAAWCLYSTAWSVTAYMLIFAITEKTSINGPALIITAAGANALLTYILPDIWYFVMHESGIKFWSLFNDGITGIVRSTIFAAIFITIAAFLNKKKFRLKV